jgi:hypothetical protein
MEVHNLQDLIDSRDVIAHLAELERVEELLDEDESEQLEILRSFAEEGETEFSDWNDGVTLIRDSYFKDYARDFVEEVYEIRNDFPYNCIDWQEVADEMQLDYTEIDFNGIIYWGRA